jgi:hypothetical protein
MDDETKFWDFITLCDDTAKQPLFSLCAALCGEEEENFCFL